MRVLLAAATCFAMSGVLPLAAAGQAPADVDAAPRLRLVEQLRIGSANDPKIGFSQFNGVNVMDVDRDGQIYVFDVQDPRIRVYDSTGHLVRAMGQRGQGPGEFLGTPRIGVVGDTVWAIENNSSRITLFNRAGNVLTTSRADEVSVPEYEGYRVVQVSGMRSNGRFSSEAVLTRLPAYYRRDSIPLPGDMITSGPVRVPRLVFDAAGAVRDTTGFDTILQAPFAPGQVYLSPDGVRRTIPALDTDQPTLVVSPDGRVMIDQTRPTAATSSTFQVTRITYDGDTVYRRTLRYLPATYSPTYLDSLAATAFGTTQDGKRAGPPSRAEAAIIRSRMQYPRFQRPIGSGWLGADGSTWLRRESAGSTTIDWILLDPAGTLRGRVSLPKGARPAWSRGDVVWMIVPDADDIPWLVKYRIGQ